MEQLALWEMDKLERCETIIENGLRTFVDVGTALLEIRDERLYRKDYGTFEDYCRERWNMERANAYRLIESSKVILNLSPTGDILPANERQARPLAQLEPDQQREAWQRVIERASDEKITAAHVQSVVDEIKQPSKMDVHYSSESNEWNTPKDIIDRVILVMGRVDIDPCSNSKDNPSVPAGIHFTQEDNGLIQPWEGKVYMNPPYGREIGDWTSYLKEQYEFGRITEAIALVPSRTDTEWFRELSEYPRCFIWGRLKFSGFDNAAPFPSMAVYFGRDIDKFISVFKDIGDVYRRI